MSEPQAQTKPKLRIHVYPSEMRYVRPLETIASYIRRRTGGARVSKHHVARIFTPLEEFLAGSGKAVTVAKIMDVFARHYGFADESEMNEVAEAVGSLVDYIAVQRAVNPVRAFRILRNIRILLIGLVAGSLAGVSFEPFEKKS